MLWVPLCIGWSKSRGLNKELEPSTEEQEEGSGQGVNQCRAPKATASLESSRERLRPRSHGKPRVRLEVGRAMWSWSLAFLLSCVFSTRVTSPSRGKRDIGS